MGFKLVVVVVVESGGRLAVSVEGEADHPAVEHAPVTQDGAVRFPLPAQHGVAAVAVDAGAEQPLFLALERRLFDDDEFGTDRIDAGREVDYGSVLNRVERLLKRGGVIGGPVAFRPETFHIEPVAARNPVQLRQRDGGGRRECGEHQ